MGRGKAVDMTPNSHVGNFMAAFAEGQAVHSGWIVGWGVKSGYNRAFLLVPNY